MKNEIKVGEYVRTKHGEFGIITEIYPRLKWIKKINPSLLDYNEIKNHDDNLMELVEVGDYVNGEKVTEIKEWKSSKDGYFRYAVTCHYEIIRADEIKTIVTKEMMESISYKVKE